jgi:hypothetical protein
MLKLGYKASAEHITPPGACGPGGTSSGRNRIGPCFSANTASAGGGA